MNRSTSHKDTHTLYGKIRFSLMLYAMLLNETVRLCDIISVATEREERERERERERDFDTIFVDFSFDHS